MSGYVGDGDNAEDGVQRQAPQMDNDPRMTLGELTEAADVSVRTVRYYIAEGLLPPPEGAGPASSYSAGHLHRLQLIQRLKAAYLPLKEIRRRLSGLDDDEIQGLLAEGDAARPSPATTVNAAWEPAMSDAREYLALLEPRARYHTEPLNLAFQAPSAAPPAPVSPTAPPQPDPAQHRLSRAKDIFQARQRTEPEASDAVQGQGLWHRIALGDEVELVISERVYARYRDRVDWLVRWARKVFG